MTGERAVRLGRFSRIVAPGEIRVAGLVVVVLIALVLASLMVGDQWIPLDRVVRAFGPDATRPESMIVVQWRAPRAFAAAVFGACLGISGAVFQSLTRNPLGSPDIIGLNTGAYTGVLVVISLGGMGYAAVSAGAVVGGVAAAGLVYLFAYSSGLQGFRLIIVGIAVSAFLGSINSWLVISSELDVALRAAVWGAGSLSGVRWPQLLGAGSLALALVALIPWLARRISQLELGDDSARTRGLRTEPVKAAAVVMGVALTALVTAVTGPIAFISLAAPQIARRIRRRSGGFDPVGAALIGAVLLAGSDLIAQHAIPAASVPVGAVTVCLGGIYLVYLLIRESDRS